MKKKIKALQIEAGSSFINVYSDDGKTILREPSVVLVDKNTGKVIAVGKEAEEKLGKVSGNIDVVNPMRYGFFVDKELAGKVLSYVISKTDNSKVLKPKVVITRPSTSNLYYDNIFCDICEQIGVRRLSFSDSLQFTARKLGIDINRDTVNMLVDVGAMVTKIGVFFNGDIVSYSFLKVAGNDFDSVIAKYITDNYNLEVSNKMAENVKINIGVVYNESDNPEYLVRARDIDTGIPNTVIVNSSEFYDELNKVALNIVESVKNVVIGLPNESVEDLIDNGIYLTGGGSKINGFKELLSESINLKIN